MSSPAAPAPAAVPATRRTVPTGGSELAVFERGRALADRPTVVMVHGWPDSSTVWDLVADLLAERFHVVTFDARGMGRSAPATGRRPYAVERMADDIDAVIAAVSPDRPVHLVGHDWGGVEGWEYVGDPDRAPRVSSFTVASGPCLDHLGLSVRSRLRRPTPSNLAGVAAQALRSSYVLALHVPVISTLPWRLGGTGLFRRWLRLTEGMPVDSDSPGPSLAQDARRGVWLYRSNVARRLVRPRERRAEVPVLMVVAARDRYVTPRLAGDVARWAPQLRRVDLDAGHWAPRTHPDALARLVAGHVDDVEGRR